MCIYYSLSLHTCIASWFICISHMRFTTHTTVIRRVNTSVICDVDTSVLRQVNASVPRVLSIFLSFLGRYFCLVRLICLFSSCRNVKSLSGLYLYPLLCRYLCFCPLYTPVLSCPCLAASSYIGHISGWYICPPPCLYISCLCHGRYHHSSN